MDIKKKILLVLAAVFIICLSYRLMHPFRQATVDKLTYTGAGSRAKTKKTSVKDLGQNAATSNVMLDIYLNPPEHSEKVYRNIFIRKKKMEKKPSQKSRPARATVKTPIELVKEDLSRFKLFGYYITAGRPAIFFEKGKDVYVVRQGDRIDGKYLVEKITQQSVSLRAEHIDEVIIIDLGSFEP